METKHSQHNQPNSLRNTVYLGIAFFLVIASHYIFKTASGGLVVNKLSAFGIPKVDILDTAFTMVVCVALVFVPRLKKRLSNAIAPIIGLAAIALCVYPFLFRAWTGSATFILLLLSLLGNFLTSAGVYLAWMLFTATIVERSWLFITLFGACAQLAVALSGLLSRLLLEGGMISTLNLIHFAGVGHLLAGILFFLALRRFRCFGITSPSVNADTLSAPPTNQVRSSSGTVFRLFASNRFVAVMCALIAVRILFRQVYHWKVYALVEQGSSSLDKASSSLAGFFQSQGFLGLAAQLILVPLALRFLTPRYGVFVQPVLAVIMVSAAFMLESAIPLLLVIAIYSSIDYTVDNCMRESYFIACSSTVKIFIKSWLAMFVPKVASMCGSASIFLLRNSDPRWWYAICALCALFWLWIAWGLSGHYRETPGQSGWQTYDSVDAVGLDSAATSSKTRAKT